MTIVTQTNDLINYQSISKISIVTGTVAGEYAEIQSKEGSKEEIPVFVVFAFDVIGSLVEDEYEDNGVSLGVYNSYDECQHALNQLIGSIGADDRFFVMPQPR